RRGEIALAAKRLSLASVRRAAMAMEERGLAARTSLSAPPRLRVNQFPPRPCLSRRNLYRRPHSGRGLVPVAPFALHEQAKPDDSRRGFAIGAKSAIGQMKEAQPCRSTS